MSKILVTGASGIVGSGIRPFLRETNEIVLYSRHNETDLEQTESVVVGDVCDHALLNRSMQGIDGVIILAASYSTTISFEETLAVNYRATIAIMDAAVNNGVKSVVFASSNHGWGFHEKSSAPLPEAAPVRPDGWYGISKIWGEAVMAYYASAYGLTTTSLRIGNTDEFVFDERRTHMWMSFQDMAKLMDVCLARRDGSHKAVFATADGPSPYFDNKGLGEMGFTPQDNPMDHLAPAADFNAEIDVHGFIGGAFVEANMFRENKP